MPELAIKLVCVCSPWAGCIVILCNNLKTLQYTKRKIQKRKGKQSQFCQIPHRLLTIVRFVYERDVVKSVVDLAELNSYFKLSKIQFKCLRFATTTHRIMPSDGIEEHSVILWRLHT